MWIMCSDVTETGVVTFDAGIGRNGKRIYRISWWNGNRWSEARYRSFDAARETYNLIRRMI